MDKQQQDIITEAIGALRKRVEQLEQEITVDYRDARGCAPRNPGAPLPEEVISRNRGNCPQPTPAVTAEQVRDWLRDHYYDEPYTQLGAAEKLLAFLRSQGGIGHLDHNSEPVKKVVSEWYNSFQCLDVLVDGLLALRGTALTRERIARWVAENVLGMNYDACPSETQQIWLTKADELLKEAK
ncbi:MAG: hypothetical protein Q7J73_08180 [Dehalococcoidales bacterium]|nr:hypothetical protein [Dehalococcoidales bacterium]